MRSIPGNVLSLNLSYKVFMLPAYEYYQTHSCFFNNIFSYWLHVDMLFFFQTSLFGEGTYLTSDLSMAFLYSPHGNGWCDSVLGPVLSCIALCEIIDHPDVKCQIKKKGKVPLIKNKVAFFICLYLVVVFFVFFKCKNSFYTTHRPVHASLVVLTAVWW